MRLLLLLLLASPVHAQDCASLPRAEALQVEIAQSDIATLKGRIAAMDYEGLSPMSATARLLQQYRVRIAMQEAKIASLCGGQK